MWIYIQQIFFKKTFLQYLIENNIDLNKINEKQNLFSSGHVHLGYIYLNTQSYNTSNNLIANKNIIINENKNWNVNSSKKIDFNSIYINMKNSLCKLNAIILIFQELIILKVV